MQRLRTTEYLDLNLSNEQWYRHVCEHSFGAARGNYEEGCSIHERDPREIHQPLIEGEYTFAPDPEWVRIVEFYCPQYGTQAETEYTHMPRQNWHVNSSPMDLCRPSPRGLSSTLLGLSFS